MKPLCLSLLLLVAAGCLRGQDFTFSQYAAMPYLINPAAVGQVPTFLPVNSNVPQTYQHRIAVIARNHWRSPTSKDGLWAGAAGWDMRLCNRQSDGTFWGFGAFVQRDQANLGRFFNFQARGMAALHRRLSRRWWMSVGVSGGLLQYGVRPSWLTFDRQFNGTTGLFDHSLLSGEATLSDMRESRVKGDMDLGFRLLDTRGGGYFGATLHHFILQPRYSLLSSSDGANRLDMGFSLQAASPAMWNRLVITALLRRQSFSESRQWQATGGLLYKFESCNFGAMLRTSGRQQGKGIMTRDALILSSSVNFSGCVLRLSWDLNLSRLDTGAGGPEVSCGWFFGNGSDCVRCPQSF